MIKKELTKWRAEVDKYDKHSYKIYKRIKNSLDPKTMSQGEIKKIMTEIGKQKMFFSINYFTYFEHNIY